MRPIDADALMEKLNGIWDCNDMTFEPVDGCCIDADCKSCRWRETIEYVKRLVKNQTTISPWHSMEDNGPPEENGPYFVYAPSYCGGSSSGKERARGVMISKWRGKHWSIEVGYYERPGCVTHWMPIEPPKEDA